MNNSAVATYNSTSSGLALGTDAVFNNLAGATFNAQNDTNLTFGGGSPQFNNDGTFVKSGGTGVTAVSNGVTFANSGSVDVQTGTLELSAGGIDEIDDNRRNRCSRIHETDIGAEIVVGTELDQADLGIDRDHVGLGDGQNGLAEGAHEVAIVEGVEGAAGEQRILGTGG